MLRPGKDLVQSLAQKQAPQGILPGGLNQYGSHISAACAQHLPDRRDMYGSHAFAQRGSHIAAGVVPHMQNICGVYLFLAQHDVKKSARIAFAGLVFCRDIDSLHGSEAFFMQDFEQERRREVHVTDSNDAFTGGLGCAAQFQHVRAWLQQGSLAQHFFFFQTCGQLRRKPVPALDMGIDIVQRGIRIPQLFFRMPAQGYKIQIERVIDFGGDEVKDVARVIDDRTGQQGIEYVEAQDMY